MLTYILLFLFGLILAVFSNIAKDTYQKKICVWIFMIVFTCLPGLRYNVGGADYFIYEDSYYSISEIGYFIKFEPGYNLIMILSNTLGFTFNQFLFSITLFSSIFLLIAIDKNTKSIFWGLFIYMAKLYIFYNFVLVRQMISIPFIWLALYYLRENNNKKFFLLLFCAIMFHFSAIIFVLVYFLRRVKWTTSKMFIILLLSLLVSLLNTFVLKKFIDYIPYIGYRLQFYFERENTLNPLNFLESFGILALATYYKKELSQRITNYSFYYNLLLIFVVLLISFYNIDVFKRIRDYFIISYIVIIPTLIQISRKGISKLLLQFIILAYIFILYIRSIIVFDISTEGLGSLIPYQNILF